MATGQTGETKMTRKCHRLASAITNDMWVVTTLYLVSFAAANTILLACTSTVLADEQNGLEVVWFFRQ